jgi:hypothetical protein
MSVQESLPPLLRRLAFGALACLLLPGEPAPALGAQTSTKLGANPVLSTSEQHVITLWRVGSPWTGEIPSRTMPPNIQRGVEKLGYRVVIASFPAKGFAQIFFHAFETHQPPDILAFDNYGILEGMTTPSGDFMGIEMDPRVRRALVQATWSLAVPPSLRGWEHLVRTSPHYQAARALFLRPADCDGVSVPADLWQRATRMTTAYLEGSPEVREFEDADRLHATVMDQQQRTVSNTNVFGYWGVGPLAFLQMVSTYDSTVALGRIATLVILRKREDQWRLLAATTDPISNTQFVSELPHLVSLITNPSLTGRTPGPAKLLEPPDGVYPKPPKGERFGEFRWRPSASPNVIAEIVEFAYNADTRLFATFFSGSPPVIGELSAGNLWETRSVWKWRVWSISDTGAISFSHARSFPH